MTAAGPALPKRTCPHPACETQIRRDKFACLPHWRSLPRLIQLRILAAYRPGQEDNVLTASSEYIEAAQAALDHWSA